MDQAQGLQNADLEKFVEDLDNVCVRIVFYFLSTEPHRRASTSSALPVTVSTTVSLNSGGSVAPAMSYQHPIYSRAL